MSSLESSSFYTALSRESLWVRVLVLHPGSLSDPIAITLNNEKLDDSCQYEAISYTWGSLDNSETIIVNDNRRLQVTHNLASALRHLRHPSEGRRLWIDAICINQQDVDERGRQVAIMHQIYKMAKTVQVWLGPAADGSELAIQTLDYIGSTVQAALCAGDENCIVLVPRDEVPLSRPKPPSLERSRRRLDKVEKPSSNSAQALADLITPPQFSEETWRAIDDLLSRPWFKRLWIRQEIQHANLAFFSALEQNNIEDRFTGIDKLSGIIDPLSTSDSPGAINVNCGSSTISWWNLRNAILCFKDKMQFGILNDGNMPLFDRIENHVAEILVLMMTRAYSWQHLLLETAGTECTDPRDRIYAIMNITNEHDRRLSIVPDYTQPAYDLFCDFTLSHIAEFRSLELLKDCYVLDDKDFSDHPSWVPRWADKSPRIHCFGLGEFYQTASSHLWSSVTRVNRETIQVLGVIIDTIDSMLEIPDITQDMTQTPDILKKWQQLVPFLFQKKHLQELDDEESYLRRLSNILTCRGFSEMSIPMSSECPNRYMSEPVIGLLVKDGVFEWETSITPEQLATLFSQINQFSGRTWAFRSTKGHIGRVPVTTQKGDSLAVLVGSPTPFILRRVQNPTETSESTTPRYCIVGACYAEGFEDGQALLGPLPLDTETVGFSSPETKGLRREYYDGSSDSWSIEDPRIMNLFSESELDEYKSSIRDVEDCKEKNAKLKVDLESLRRIGAQAQAIYLI